MNLVDLSRNQLISLLVNANGNVIVIDLNYDSQINESILKIWNKYKRLNGIELSKLTRILYSANQVTD